MKGDLNLSPWTELNRMWNLMDRAWPTRDFEFAAASFPIDLYQQNNQLIVRASVPGVKPEDVNVSIDQGVLTITGETCDEFENRQGNRMFHREHTYGKFVRSVRLPADLDETAIDAHIENGILTISLPISKAQQTLPRQIPVQSVNGKSSGIGEKAYADQPSLGDGDAPNANREKVGQGGRKP